MVGILLVLVWWCLVYVVRIFWCSGVPKVASINVLIASTIKKLLKIGKIGLFSQPVSVGYRLGQRVRIMFVSFSPVTLSTSSSSSWCCDICPSDNCPRQHVPKRQLSKETCVQATTTQGDSCPSTTAALVWQLSKGTTVQYNIHIKNCPIAKYYVSWGWGWGCWGPLLDNRT